MGSRRVFGRFTSPLCPLSHGRGELVTDSIMHASILWWYGFFMHIGLNIISEIKHDRH